MSKLGKNPTFTYEELETLGMVVSKISARLAQVMATYPPKRSLRVSLKKSNSRRSTLMIRLLTQFTNGSNVTEYSSNQPNLKEALREVAHSYIFDETDIVSSWENTPKSLSSKEETVIMHSLMERGIVENIVGKKQVETTGTKLKETGGYPSTYRLTKESKYISQLLSKREAVDFILSSLTKSKLLFIFYWYLFTSLLYFFRDYGKTEINQLVTMGKRFIPNYQPPEYFTEPRLKSALASIDDQELVRMTKILTTEVMKTGKLNTWNQFLLIGAFLKLNRSLD